MDEKDEEKRPLQWQVVDSNHKPVSFETEQELARAVVGVLDSLDKDRQEHRSLFQFIPEMKEVSGKNVFQGGVVEGVSA